jgi:4-amino-4-deoxy-L-arabinose transferase-like glycosyltransferase
LGIVAAVAAAFYFSRLGWSPPFLSIDEVWQARQVLSLAHTGQDLSQRHWPLYFGEPGYEGGREPLWIYSAAGIIRLVPFSEAAIRVPSAIAGWVDVLLMFLLARRLFGSQFAGVAAAALIALTPAHFIHARLATSQIGTVPFVLAWLLFLVRYLDEHRRIDLFVSGACLGLGVYSYLAAIIMLPLYLVLMIVVLRRHMRLPLTPTQSPFASEAWVVAAGVAAALVPWFVWHLAHPERFHQLYAFYAQNNGYRFGLTNLRSPEALLTHLDVWWNSFNPSRMFFSGDSSLRYSTRQAGYFLIAALPLIGIGSTQLRRSLVHSELSALFLSGLALGPLPAAIIGDADFKRWISVVPFVVVIGTCGAKHLSETLGAPGRVAVAAVALAASIQFGGFLRGYWGDYRTEASFYFGGNLRGAIHEVLKTADDPTCVFLDNRVGILAYWQLYARVFGRETFATHPQLVDAESPTFALPTNCREADIIVLEKEVLNHKGFRDKLNAQGWTATGIPEPDGRVVLSVYRRISG